MTDDFKTRLSQLDPARRALVEKLRSAQPPAIVRRPDTGHCRLSAIQEQLWFLDQVAPGEPTYNVVTASRLHGPLCTDALNRALAALAVRHESLRTVFAAHDGHPYQVVRAPQPVALSVADLSDVPAHEVDDRVDGLLHEEVHGLFDLATGPLFRARLITVSEEDHVLALSAHHSVVDGVSIGIITGELAELYAAELDGRAPRLSELPLRYTDFAAWQREHYLDSPAMEKHLAYWETRLRGVPALDLPSDRPRPAVFSFRGAYARHRTSPELRQMVHEYARGSSVSALMQVMAAFQAVLHRYTGATTLAVGTTVPGRTRRELEAIVGCFTNFIVLRTELSGALTFGELLSRVSEVLLSGWEHQDAPFEQVVKRLNGTHDPSRNPLFSVSLQLLDASTGGGFPRLPATSAEPVDLRLDRARFDLAMSVVDDGHDFEFITEYSTDLFDADRVDRLMRHVERVLAAGLMAPETALSRLPLLDEEERSSVLRFARGPERPYRVNALPELVTSVARRSPDAVAVVAAHTSVTYAELDRRADVLAATLVAAGVRTGDRVGVALGRGIDAVVAILAVNRAGAAYVALDLGLPVARLAYILTDSGCVRILVHASHRGKVEQAGGPDGVLCLDELPQTPPQTPALSAAVVVAADADAYVSYSSGPAGVPKGVAITHAMVCAFLDGMTDVQTVDASARTLHASPLAVDTSIAEIFSTLAGGGTLVVGSRDDVLIPGRLQQLLRRERVTHLFATPDVLRSIPAEDYPDLRGVTVMGEACPAALAKAWQADGRRVCTAYGPAEATVACIGFDLSDWGAAEDPPIGRPLAHRRAHVVDENLQPVPIGVPGELLLAGAGVASASAYRSGALASWDADGRLRIHGRLDGQVIVRGQRIELGDIEVNLTRHPRISAAAVVLTVKGEPEVVAYVVADGEVTRAEVRAALAAQLPAYMIPSTVMSVNELPLLPSGAVNRSALPAPDDAPGEAVYVAPRTPAEALVADVFGQVLGRERVSAEADFFALGGHSLLAARAVAMLARRSGIQLRTQVFYIQPTVAALAQQLTESSGEVVGQRPDDSHKGSIAPAPKARDCMVALNPGGTQPPLFCPHAVSGSPFSYGGMARALGPDQPVYGFECPGLDGEIDPTADMGRLAAAYNQELLAKVPSGAIRLAGWSMGGFLVFEMARQLVEDHGRDVELVAMLDPDPPGPYHDAGELEVAQRFAHELAAMSGGDEPTIDAGILALDEATRLRVVGKTLIGAGLMPADVPESFVRNRYAVFRANMMALYTYQPLAYSKAVVHIAAAESDSTAPLWSQYAGDMRTVTVPGGHYSMFAPPDLPALAAALKACLS